VNIFVPSFDRSFSSVLYVILENDIKSHMSVLVD